MAKNGSVSDGELIALFGQHVAVINSERSTIWQRYSAMMIANSLILSFGPNSVWVAMVGIFLCICWRYITRKGWEILRSHIKEAAKFQFTSLLASSNPFSTEANDHIEGVAIAVIFAFAAIYAVQFLCLVQYFEAPWLCTVSAVS